MVWICLGLVSGTCDIFSLILVVLLVAFVLADLVGLVFSLLCFISPKFDAASSCLLWAMILSFVVFFVGGLVYLGGG